MTAYTVLYPVNELKVGGAEQQLLELVRGLDKGRFRPVVAPLYGGGPLEAEFRRVPGVEVIPVNRRGRFDFSPLWTLGRILRAYRVAIVQPFLSPATFFGLIPAFILGTPVKVVTERCGVRRRRHLGYHLYRTVEDFFTNFSDVVIANSLAGRDLLLSRGIQPGRIRVVYNGVNPDRLRSDLNEMAAIRARLGVPEDGQVVGIVASLTPPKDHETFLRAAAILAPNHPGVRFAVVGDGPLRPQLENLAHRLGIGPVTAFFGYRRDVANFLSLFSVLVSSSCDNEGCSNSVLEAMALGVPVVATAIGGNRELIRPGETGLLVEPGNPPALAAAIERALFDRAGAGGWARRALEMVDDYFSLGRMVAEYEAIYTELLEQKGLAVPTVGRGRRTAESGIGH